MELGSISPSSSSEADFKVIIHSKPTYPSWKLDIYRQLCSRNHLHVNSIGHVVKQYNTLLERSRNLEEKNLELEKEVTRLTTINSNLNKKQKLLYEQLNGTVNVPELERKIQKLQEELTMSYKRNSENATVVLDLTKQARSLEEELKQMNHRFEEKSQELQSKQVTIRELENDIQKREIAQKVTNEEIIALKREVSGMFEKMKLLEQDNQDLLTRWNAKIAEEARKKNEELERETRNLQQTVLFKAEEESRRISLDRISSEWIRKTKELKVPSSLPSGPKIFLDCHKGGACSVSFNSSGAMFATGGEDYFVTVWDAISYVLKFKLNGCMLSVNCVDFSANDEFLLGASNDRCVKIWSAQNGRMQHSLNGHTANVRSAQFSGDSKKVFSCSQDRTIRIWDLGKGYCTKVISSLSACNMISSTLDGFMICSGHTDSRVRIWDGKNGDLVKEWNHIHLDQVTSVSLSPDERFLLTNSRDGTMKIIDVRTFEILQTLVQESYRNYSSWNTACWSPDGQYTASGSMEGGLIIWNVRNTTVEKTLKSDRDKTIHCVSWSSSGMQLATADKMGVITIWN